MTDTKNSLLSKLSLAILAAWLVVAGVVYLVRMAERDLQLVSSFGTIALIWAARAIACSFGIATVLILWREA